jgi:uncharacterized protein
MLCNECDGYTDVMSAPVTFLNLKALYDRSRPVHKLAARLQPYLRIVARDFRPTRLVLFGSWAYGQPDEHSDVDLLIVKPIQESTYKDALAIRRAFRPLATSVQPIPFDLLVESPEGDQARIRAGGAFYEDINRDGINLLLEGGLKTDENNPDDWYRFAADKLSAADAVFAVHGPSLAAVELLHEAVEPYMKGWLISKGWRLIRTHNLVTLLEAGMAYEPQLSGHMAFAEDLTQQFFLQHYPGGDISAIGQNYDELRSATDKLIKLIQVPRLR